MTSSSKDIGAPDRSRKPVDWVHWTIVLVVFSITGSLSMLLGRLLLKNFLNLEGEFWAGPWSYRIAYLLLITPVYSVTLVLVGTLFGKHAYFKQKVLHMWGYLLPRRRRTEVIQPGSLERSVRPDN